MPNPYANGLRMEDTSTRRFRAPDGVTSDGYAKSAAAADADLPAEGLESGAPEPGEAPLAAPRVTIPAFPGKGFCLAETDLAKVARRLIAELEKTEDAMAEPRARWRVNDKRRRGVVGVQLLTERTADDRVTFEVYAPPGSKAQAPTFNKLNRLCRRLKSNVFVDPYVPEATPGELTGSDDAEAAEFATRALQAETGPHVLNLHQLGKRAFDLASTYDSGFVEYFIHPRGGGRQPQQIEASPVATTVEDATHTVVQIPVTVQDPATGQSIPTGEMRTVEVPQPGPFILRYVRADGSLTDERKEAAQVWVPRVRADVYPAKAVRLFPSNCASADDAELILLGQFVTLGELRQRLQFVREMTADRLRAMIDYRPKHPKDFLPPDVKEPRGLDDVQRSDDGSDDADRIPDSVHVFVLKAYFSTVGEYEDGAYVLVGGDCEVLHRQPLMEIVDGETVHIPPTVAQMKQFDDGTEDPRGRGAAHVLGGGNEVRAALVGNLIESLYKINTAKTFYTPAGLYQPKSASIAELYVPIEAGSAPVKEQVAEPPAVAYQLLELSGAEMDDEIGLSPVAQGENPPSVQSGLHAQTLIEQTIVGLSDVKQNVEDFYLRSWRIILALMRCYYPRQLLQKYLGDDQPHKLESWLAAELSTNVDLRLMPGSGTMLAPSAKMAVGEYAAQMGLLDTAQLRRTWTSNAGGLIGAQDDPHLTRIERQIRRFLRGPVPGSDPTTWPQQLADIWTIMPNDEEPQIAQLRHDELSRMISSTRFSRLDVSWQPAGVAEFERMRMAAGVTTLAEQAAAAEEAARRAAQPTGGGGGGEVGGSATPPQPGGSGLDASTAGKPTLAAA